MRTPEEQQKLVVPDFLLARPSAPLGPAEQPKQYTAILPCAGTAVPVHGNIAVYCHRGARTRKYFRVPLPRGAIFQDTTQQYTAIFPCTGTAVAVHGNISVYGHRGDSTRKYCRVLFWLLGGEGGSWGMGPGLL
jgi:hypothetical protein